MSKKVVVPPAAQAREPVAMPSQVGASGIVEVDVCVDHARQHDEAARVESPRVPNLPRSWRTARRRCR